LRRPDGVAGGSDFASVRKRCLQANHRLAFL
jgi:hypothetical protein